MNHFLLPGNEGAARNSESTRYGVHAMELLVNGLLSKGARRDRLEAKLFGGACMIEGLTDVGRQNAEFAEQFLIKEQIPFRGGSLRGQRGRRVQFWPVAGRARALAIEQNESSVFAAERSAKPTAPVSGCVELF